MPGLSRCLHFSLALEDGVFLYYVHYEPLTTTQMRLSLLLFLAFSSSLLSAQTTYYSDDFESYNVDEYLCPQSDDWTTWTGVEGTIEDAMVSNANAAMGTNSVYISSPDGSTTSDLFLPLGDQTSGQWSFSFYLFVTSENFVSFNLQKHTDIANNPAWATELWLYPDGSGEWIAQGGTIPFTYTNNAWVHYEFQIDLDNDLAKGFVDGLEILEWQWSISNGGDNSLQLGGFNIYGWAQNGSSECYFDEVLVTGPDAFTSVEEQLEQIVSIYPNPATSELFVNVGSQQIKSIQIHDMTGHLVTTVPISNPLQSVIRVDVESLASGIYAMTVLGKDKRYEQQFVVE